MREGNEGEGEYKCRRAKVKGRHDGIVEPVWKRGGRGVAEGIRDRGRRNTGRNMRGEANGRHMCTHTW